MINIYNVRVNTDNKNSSVIANGNFKFDKQWNAECNEVNKILNFINQYPDYNLRIV